MEDEDYEFGEEDAGTTRTTATMRDLHEKKAQTGDQVVDGREGNHMKY